MSKREILTGPDLEAYEQVLAEINQRHLGENGVVITVPEKDIHIPQSPLSGLDKPKSEGDGRVEFVSNISRKVPEHVHISLVRATLRIVRKLKPKDAGNAFDQIKKAA